MTIRNLVSLLLMVALALAPVLGAEPTSAMELDTFEYTKRAAKKAVKAHTKREKKQLKRARKYLRKHPEWIGRYRADAVEDPQESQSVLYATDEGPAQTLLDPLAHGMLDLGARIDQGFKKDNLISLYRTLYNATPPQFTAQLLDPSQIAQLGKRKVKRRFFDLVERVITDFGDIIDLISQVHPGLIAVNPIGECTAEAGYEAGDEISARCLVSEYATDGVLANIDFGLKDDLTCIKDQGARGTCSAHGVTAAIETLVMVDGDGPYNLSEEYAYFDAKIHTDYATRYTDGLSTAAVLQDFEDHGIRIPHEESWNYGRSRGRGGFDSGTNQFPNSCLTYNIPPGEMCTDYSFHAEETLLQIPGFSDIATFNFPLAPVGQGYGITGHTTFPDFSNVPPWNDPDLDLDLAILTLEDDVPVLASLQVPPAFRSPDANGYVQFVAGEQSSGSHLILLVAFISNADLPAGAPTDPAGEGVFVAKNSWGKGYGDCGFSYITYQFMQNWRNSLWYVDGVF